MSEKRPLRPDLERALSEIGGGCTACGACLRQCAFLRRYGHPMDIAAAYEPEKAGNMPFQCSLCGLCGAFCQEGVEPADMFLAMRREAVDRGLAPLRRYKPLLAYERRGMSSAFAWQGLPDGCEDVFFPGCALPGTRPDTTSRIAEHLRGLVPKLGVVLDCCAKPSHDLGRQNFFEAHFFALRDGLLEKGVRRVLTACPNCQKVFQAYGGELAVKSVYELMAEQGAPVAAPAPGEAVVHDSCVLRHEPTVHGAVRKLAREAGVDLSEMKRNGKGALCCGEGGAVGFIDEELARSWTGRRAEQAGGRKVITYCAGCADFLKNDMEVVHLADLLVDPGRALAGKAKVSTSPVTYLNRWLLKGRLRKLLNG